MTSSKHYPSPYLSHILVNRRKQNYNTSHKCTTLPIQGTVGESYLTRIVPFRYGEFAGTLSHKISAADPSEIEECNNDKLLKNRKICQKNVEVQVPLQEDLSSDQVNHKPSSPASLPSRLLLSFLPPSSSFSSAPFP